MAVEEEAALLAGGGSRPRPTTPAARSQQRHPRPKEHEGVHGNPNYKDRQLEAQRCQ
jgi:hypothetical protein